MIRDSYRISESSSEDVVTLLRKYLPENEYEITVNAHHWVKVRRKNILFGYTSLPTKDTDQSMIWTGYLDSSSSWNSYDSVSCIKVYINIDEKTKCVFFEGEGADGTLYYNGVFLKDCFALKERIYYNYDKYFTFGEQNSDKVISLAPFINYKSISDTIEKDENVYFLAVGPSLYSKPSMTFNLNGHKYKTINNYLVYKIE